MTHPLVWIFAIAGGLLALWFLFAAWLAYRHARDRARDATDLTSYIVHSGERMRSMRAENVKQAQEQRANVMQLTIGDLVRDESLVLAAAAGIAERRQAMKNHAARRGEPST
jgi:ABC-type bacteriocin/lantibiotic exporter with double-glycine peptidase domain